MHVFFGSSMDRLAHSLKLSGPRELADNLRESGQVLRIFVKGCEGQRSKMILISTERPFWVFTSDFKMILT